MATKTENKGVIPFRKDFNPKDMKTVKYTRTTTNNNGDQNKISMEVPIVPIGGSKSQLLYVLTRFRKAETTLNWTNGATLYANFENQMEDVSEWDTISNPFPRSVAGFNDAMEAYLTLKFPADAWEIHRKMVTEVKKSLKESPTEFMSLINFHDQILNVLPGYPGAGAPNRRLSDYDKKHIIYNGVTEEYRNNFRKAGMRLTDVSLTDLLKYMEDLWSIDPVVQRALHGGGSSTTTGSRDRRNTRPGQRSERFQRPTMDRRGFRGYTGQGRQGFSGRGYNTGQFNRYPTRPSNFQPGRGNYNNYQGNRGNAMTPRRLPFGGGNNNGTPRSNRPGNYQPNRGGESNYNNNHSRGPRPTRDGYYNGGKHGGSRAQGSQYGRGGSSGRQARSRQGGNRSSHYIDSNEAYYAGEDDYEVDDFGYDDDGYFGEDMDGDYDEGYDEHYGDCEDQDDGADDGYYGEEYGDGFHNEFQFEDPDGLLEDDPSPEELNIAEDLEDGYYMDNSSSGSLDSAPSSLPVLRQTTRHSGKF